MESSKSLTQKLYFLLLLSLFLSHSLTLILLFYARVNSSWFALNSISKYRRNKIEGLNASNMSVIACMPLMLPCIMMCAMLPQALVNTFIYMIYTSSMFIFSLVFPFHFRSIFIFTMVTTSDDAIGLMLKDIYSSIIETNAYAEQAS